MGAVSLHSVSRLMSDEDDGTRHSKSEQADSSSPSERDNINRADELLPDTSIVQNEIHFKSAVTGLFCTDDFQDFYSYCNTKCFIWSY